MSGSIDQKRAAHALRCVQALNSKGSSKEYVNLVKGAPALVMTNGLIAALAYLQNKSDDGRSVVKDILSWLRLRELSKTDDFQAAVCELVGERSVSYMRITEEALEFLRWLRQLAPALTKKAHPGSED
ncbi:MAG: type III-B CRISPR module-associated protein Cmr5 [Candidatus Riflebacteria bacterium]|nr:type III-B CRISPR module-associated protein Cmr5 [Candidatus Riflebacteria bacterium]